MICNQNKIIAIKIVFITNLAIQHCTVLFLNIKKILQLLSTLPVISATPECTFSDENY